MDYQTNSMLSSALAGWHDGCNRGAIEWACGRVVARMRRVSDVHQLDDHRRSNLGGRLKEDFLGIAELALQRLRRLDAQHWTLFAAGLVVGLLID